MGKSSKVDKFGVTKFAKGKNSKFDKFDIEKGKGKHKSKDLELSFE